MRRDVTKDIWRAVVVAGAMLGTGACSSAPKQETAQVDQNMAANKVAATPDAGVAKVMPPPPPDAAPPPPPDAAPVKRPRGSGGKPRGRGFVLA